MEITANLALLSQPAYGVSVNTIFHLGEKIAKPFSVNSFEGATA